MILHSFKSNLIVKVPVTLLFFNLFPTSFQNFSEFSSTEIILNIRTFTLKNHNYFIFTGDFISDSSTMTYLLKMTKLYLTDIHY